MTCEPKVSNSRQLTGADHAIIKRSSGFMLAFVFGHGLGYVLILTANYSLSSMEFGIFYMAWMIITVMFAPVTSCLLVMTRVLADAAGTVGRAALARLTLKLLVACLRWGVPVVVIAGGVLSAVGASLGGPIWATFLLIPPIVLVLILVEVQRTAFQALLLFRWSSLVWIVSQSVQLCFAATALLVWHRVWPSMLGVVLGAASVCLGFCVWFLRESRGAPSPIAAALPLRFGRESWSVLSYSLFVLMSNVDVLVAYRVLPTGDLGAYAASALLPKAIVTATFAISQVVLPIVVKQQSNGVSVDRTIAKALALVLGIALIATGLFWVLIPFVQRTPFAIRELNLSTLMTLAAGAAGLSAWRVLIVVEIAMRRFAAGVAQAIPVLLVVGVCFGSTISGQRLAEVYTLVIWGFCFVLFAAHYLPNVRRLLPFAAVAGLTFLARRPP